MSEKDVRWIQRYSNYAKALGQLSKFIEKKELNELEKHGLIQAFEYTYELAWNTIKDYFENQGETEIHGSRDAFRLAFKRGLVENGQAWMDMIKSRTLTMHTYNQEVADTIADAVFNIYYTEFVRLEKTFQALIKKDE
jgi:nucleotidyltransferase substrate binding protein (TIGR01987 family)